MNRIIRDYQFALLALPVFVLALILPLKLVGLGAAALLALYAFINPKNGLLILLMYFPTRSFLIELNPALKIVGDLIILAAFARVVLQLALKGDWKKIFQFHLFEWGFFLFCAVGAISAYLTGVSIGAIVFQLRAFLITYIVFYVVRRLDITKEDIKRFLWTTFWMAILLCLQGLVEKMSLRTLLMPEKWVQRQLSPNNRTRIYSLINNPNVFAVYLSIAFMLSLYLKTFIQGKMKWVVNIGMLLMLGLITLTYSRGTWIGFVVALVVYFIFSRDWRKTGNIFVAAVLAIILINIPVEKATSHFQAEGVGDIPRTGAPEEPGETPSVQEERIGSSFEKSTLELSKTTGRLFMVNKGIEIFKDHPIIGTGFATFGDSAAKGYSSPIYDDYGIGFNIYTDNQYIQVIAQTGTVGVILFATFLLGMLFLLWKKRKETPLALPLMGALLGVFAMGVLYNIWEDKTYTTYFFMMLAVVLAAPWNTKKANQ
jgi:putative inorganic carbon (hco3(-)) transporter